MNNKDVDYHEYEQDEPKQVIQGNSSGCINVMFGLLLFYSLALTGFMFMQQKNIENFYVKFENM